MEVYDIIGTGYNTTRQADQYIASRLWHFLNPLPGKLYLDVGCGTGNYTIALAKAGADFVGVEPSGKMIEEALKRNQKIKWLQGTAENIPERDNIFHGVMATLTIHHWKDLDKAFNEIYRVTKDNAPIVLFTATPQQMEGYWLNHYFPQMLKSSIVQMPTFETIQNAFVRAGFEIVSTEKYFIQGDLQDCFLYAGKHRPELYFNEEIRRGISSFSALANVDEVAKGLAELKLDLESGEFEEIKNSYDNDWGDYLFIIANKKMR